MASMKDVADKAGVSISTVSRVISGKIPVDDKTQKKVQKAIEDLNYKPNLLAKGLRLKSGYFVGLCVPEISDPAFARIISSVEQDLVKNGYDLLLGNTHSNPNMEKWFIQHLLRRHVDGIIFSRVSDESRALDLFGEVDIPVVLLDRGGESVGNVYSVVLDNRKAGQIAARYFIETGHKRVGCITGPLSISLCRERLKGFKNELEMSGLRLDDRCVYEGNFRYESGREGIDCIIKADKKITAVWAHDDQMAIGMLKRLSERNISVPEAISVIGMDDIDVAALTHPALTSIEQPFEEMSEKAVDIVLNKEKYLSIIHKKTVFDPKLVVRDSTRNMP